MSDTTASRRAGKSAASTPIDPIRAAIRDAVREELADPTLDRGPQLLTVKRAGLTRRKLPALIAQGLVVTKMGRDLMIERASLDRLVEINAVRPRPLQAESADDAALEAIDPKIRARFERAARGEK